MLLLDSETHVHVCVSGVHAEVLERAAGSAASGR